LPLESTAIAGGAWAVPGWKTVPGKYVEYRNWLPPGFNLAAKTPETPLRMNAWGVVGKSPAVVPVT
jgi:hypothetical protein